MLHGQITLLYLQCVSLSCSLWPQRSPSLGGISTDTGWAERRWKCQLNEKSTHIPTNECFQNYYYTNLDRKCYRYRTTCLQRNTPIIHIILTRTSYQVPRTKNSSPELKDRQIFRIFSNLNIWRIHALQSALLLLILIIAGWSLCFVFHFSRAVLLPSFFSIAFSFRFLFILFIFSFFIFSSKQIVWCAGLQILLFARVPIAVGIAWPDYLAVFAMCTCLVICDLRARALLDISTDTGCAGCRWVDGWKYQLNVKKTHAVSDQKL